MHTLIQKWGNSLALRIPAFVSKKFDFKAGSSVEVIIQGNHLVIEPHTKELDKFLEKITEENCYHEAFKEIDAKVGKEIW